MFASPVICAVGSILDRLFYCKPLEVAARDQQRYQSCCRFMVIVLESTNQRERFVCMEAILLCETVCFTLCERKRSLHAQLPSVAITVSPPNCCQLQHNLPLFTSIHPFTLSYSGPAPALNKDLMSPNHLSGRSDQSFNTHQQVMWMRPQPDTEALKKKTAENAA